VRAATSARLVVGSACLVVPRRVLGAVGGPDRDDARVRGITRVLGVRLVLQAGLDLAAGRRTRDLDVVIELAHAASMLLAAVLWPPHRRAALASAAVATGIALLDVSQGRVGGDVGDLVPARRPTSPRHTTSAAACSNC
jgi:hypothetical protein